MLELHRHHILSLRSLSRSYLNRAVKSSIALPFARTVNVLARPSTSFLFSTIRRSSFKLNRKMDADEDGPIEVGDRSQSRENVLSIKRVKGVSSQVTITSEIVWSVAQFLSSMR